MNNVQFNVILTGAAGMVGEGVLKECLDDPRIGTVLSLARRHGSRTHPKLKELVVPDLRNLSAVKDQLHGYDICFYCLGTTSMGKTEEQYTEVTFGLTMSIATALSQQNPGMIFSYLSALGADNTEKGRVMWARIKGRTENALGHLRFGHFYAFRPQLLTPNKHAASTHAFYNYISWVFPIGRLLFPNSFCTLQELAKSMINASISGFPKNVITPIDMVKLAKQIPSEM